MFEWLKRKRASLETEMSCPYVLIVSDDEQTRATVVAVLQGKQYEARGADVGAMGLEVLDACEPDILIGDFQNPQVDGKDFLSKARLRLGKSAFPLVLFLRDTDDDEIIAERMGVDAMINKPIKDGDLITALDKLMERRKPASAASAKS